LKDKKCKICKVKFTPTRQLQPTCNEMECMIAYSDKHLAKKAKETKTQHRIEKREFNNQDVKKRTNDLKKVVQEYARLRDFHEVCISCRKPSAKQWDGGHFMNAEYHSKVRFNTLNINKQCSHCNDFSASNALNYKIHLIDKIGLEKVEWLEQQKGICKYTPEYLNRFIKIYRKRVRILKKRLDL